MFLFFFTHQITENCESGTLGHKQIKSLRITNIMTVHTEDDKNVWNKSHPVVSAGGAGSWGEILQDSSSGGTTPCNWEEVIVAETRPEQ